MATDDVRIPGKDQLVRVIVAPDSFKGTVSARHAAVALARGWSAVRPGDEVSLLPLADGGEGTVDAFAAASPNAQLRVTRVSGPDGRAVDASWLLLPDGTAVTELAESSGLPLMAAPDPLGSSTVGLGEVLAAAREAGAQRIVVGLGGSASTDGGTGALRALGAGFLGPNGRELLPGGGALLDLAEVDLDGLTPPPPGGVTLLCDVTAPLLGPAGAAHVFGPQKGASPAQVGLLDEALTRLAGLLRGEPATPGMGAAGGTAYGLAAAWGATIAPGARTVAELAGLPAALTECDLVLTGEGRFDRTSLSGKVVGGVIDLAAAAGVPVGIVAGSLAGEPPASVRLATSLIDHAGSLEAALAEPERWLEEAGRALAARA
ncbi:glycerate kinase [Lysobacter korlensis]|uniref:Glycerate kinase n=1 Tax=Lysobacter korlensis TaxID=553636 RepID=A0ABV6RXD6_9GAMM